MGFQTYSYTIQTVHCFPDEDTYRVPIYQGGRQIGEERQREIETERREAENRLPLSELY